MAGHQPALCGWPQQRRRERQDLPSVASLPAWWWGDGGRAHLLVELGRPRGGAQEEADGGLGRQPQRACCADTPAQHLRLRLCVVVYLFVLT